MKAPGPVKGLRSHPVYPHERAHESYNLSFQLPTGTFHVETHPVGHSTDFQRYG